TAAVLFVDSALYSSGATFTNCQIEGYPLAESPAFTSAFTGSATYTSTDATLTSTTTLNAGALTTTLIPGDGTFSHPNNGTLSFSFGQTTGKTVLAGLTTSRSPSIPTSSSI